MRVLELGGGDNPQYHGGLQPNGDYYINIDIRPMPTVDQVVDLDILPLPFTDGEFDKIYSAFSFEHISWRNIEAFVREVYRLTKKPGGRVFITVPNLREQARWLVRTKSWQLNREVSMIFGDLNYKDNSHKCSMSPELWKQVFEAAGFTRVLTYPLWVFNTDMVLEAYT